MSWTTKSEEVFEQFPFKKKGRHTPWSQETPSTGIAQFSWSKSKWNE